MAWTPQSVFTNADFEDGNDAQPWIPDGWALSEGSSLWAYASCDGFDTGGAETFEGGWGIDIGYPTDSDAIGWRHETADRSDMSGFSIADEADCIVTANAIKIIANAHFASTDYHVIADPRTISSADATDLASLKTLVDELYTDTAAHILDATPTWHTYKGYDLEEIFNPGPATTLEGCQLSLFAVILGFGRHLWWRGLNVRWTAFTSATQTSIYDLFDAVVDQDMSLLVILNSFDYADVGSSEDYEDFEEGWTSAYLSPTVQAALGMNEDRTTTMSPSLYQTIYGDEFDSFEEGWGTPRHNKSDESDLDGQNLSTQTGAENAANLLKQVANDHFPSTVYHKAADSRTISSADATDLASLITLVNELYSDTRTHALDASLTWHLVATDNLDVPSSNDYPATDLSSATSVLLQVLVFFAKHLFWKSNDRRYEVFDQIVTSSMNASTDVFLYLAQFDAANDAYEDFEQEWNDNENRITSFTVTVDLTLVTLFDGSSAESFGYKRPFSSVPVTPATASQTLDVDHNKAFYFETTGTWVATYKLQLRVSTGGDWIDYEEFTSNVEIEVPKGYRQARVYCVAYTSGSITPTVHWERMEVY